MSTAAGWEVEKDVLYPGRVVVPGPGGRPMSYTFTPHDARHIARTANAQLADGWHQPLAWEHQDVEPVRLSQGETARLSQAEKDREFAKSVFGFAKAYRVGPDGRVRVTLAGTDPRDLEQFKKLRFVSPEIQWDWRDSDGRVWRGPSITHIAATARPVQRHQTPVGVRMSLRAREIQSFEKFVGAVRVAPTLHPSTPPAGRLRLSLSDYEAPPMADELDFGASDDTEGDTGGKGTGKGSAWERIAAALESVGIKLGGVEIKDADHLADLIEVACANGEDADMAGDDDLSDLDEEPEPNQPAGDVAQPPEGAAAAPQPPFQMSLQAARKQQQQAEGFARKNLASRIDALEADRKVTPAIAADLRSQIPALRLSFAGSGEVKANALTLKLDAYEALPKNAAWSPAAPRGKKVAARLSTRGNPAPRPAYDRTDDDHGVDPKVLAEQERLAKTYSVGTTK